MEAVAGGSFRRARAELGLSAFGMQVIDLPPNVTGYPEHDHSADGQEEVYIALRGWADVDVDGERVRLDRDTMLAVPSGVKRTLLPGDEGLRVVVVGGVPGQAYEPKGFTELGGPDPTAR
jgi:uncharacterized cupin superfamily protein